MNDLFEDCCPHCRRPYAEQTPPDFAEFWASVPKGCKADKEAALRAWRKLTTADKQGATEKVKQFYGWFSKTYPTASPLHPSTYLNRKRWQDDVLQAPAANADLRKAIEEGMKSPVPAVREHFERTLKRLKEEGKI